VLRKHWPDSHIYGDIRTISEYDSSERWGSFAVDILTGGFPCQPFSAAGRRRGTEDERYLWPEMLRIIRLAKPAWVIGENVGGFVTWNEGMVLERICSDLESENYSVQPFIIPACAVQAPHRRERIWIVAHSERNGIQGRENQSWKERKGKSGNEQLSGLLFPQIEDALSVTRIYRTDHGVSTRLDIHRNKALGNAIVPQVATEIMKAIKLSNPTNRQALGGVIRTTVKGDEGARVIPIQRR
jgi:DNA (cytosine-5)-methyltransferase 1